MCPGPLLTELPVLITTEPSPQFLISISVNRLEPDNSAGQRAASLVNDSGSWISMCERVKLDPSEFKSSKMSSLLCRGRRRLKVI